MNLMPMPKHSLLFLAIAYVASCSPLFAEDQKQIAVRVMAVGSSEMPELYLVTKSEEGMSRVHWSKRQPSKTVHARCSSIDHPF